MENVHVPAPDYMVRIRDILINNSDELPDFCREFLAKLQKHIEQNCVHEWIDDSIDTCAGECSIPIRYCVHCYATKGDSSTSNRRLGVTLFQEPLGYPPPVP